MEYVVNGEAGTWQVWKVHDGLNVQWLASFAREADARAYRVMLDIREVLDINNVPQVVTEDAIRAGHLDRPGTSANLTMLEEIMMREG